VKGFICFWFAHRPLVIVWSGPPLRLTYHPSHCITLALIVSLSPSCHSHCLTVTALALSLSRFIALHRSGCLAVTALAISLSPLSLSRCLAVSLSLVTALVVTSLAGTYYRLYLASCCTTTGENSCHVTNCQRLTRTSNVSHQSIDWFTTPGGGEGGRGMIMRE
jgi:hypothetical protein